VRFALEAGALAMRERDFEADCEVDDERWAEIRGCREGEITPEFRDFLSEDAGRCDQLIEDRCTAAVSAASWTIARRIVTALSAESTRARAP
jgi:hypothetical protein